MTTDADLPVAERLLRLLQHLGIERAHIAGAVPGDWRDLAARHADRIASLTLVCPLGIDPSALAGVASRSLVFLGDHGPTADRVHAGVAGVPGVLRVALSDYLGLLFEDPAADRGDEIVSALLDFVKRLPAPASSGPREGAGEVAGLSYRVEGQGAPLLLLPLALAPSQWDPLVARLREHFLTIVLGGPHVGMIPILEGRGSSPGHLRIVENVIDEVALRPREHVLDVGCGSGVLDRWLATRTQRANPITSVDVNRYLLREADALVRKSGLEDVITLREADAEALPFDDASFDVALSMTVMEEGDAERMLAELVRVTRPGGRVAAVVRGDDCAALLTLQLRSELRAKAERAPAAGAVPRGCADASLYRRFHDAGLRDVRCLPQFAVYDDPRSVMAQYLQTRILATLGPDEAEEWRAAAAKAEAAHAFLLGIPHHCAVGTKR